MRFEESEAQMCGKAVKLKCVAKQCAPASLFKIGGARANQKTQNNPYTHLLGKELEYNG